MTHRHSHKFIMRNRNPPIARSGLRHYLTLIGCPAIRINTNGVQDVFTALISGNGGTTEIRLMAFQILRATNLLNNILSWMLGKRYNSWRAISTVKDFLWIGYPVRGFVKGSACEVTPEM